MRILVAVALIALVASEPLTFEAFKHHFQKSYDSPAMEQRARENFAESVARAEKLSAADPMATFGITKFSDLSPSEFRAMYLSKPSPHYSKKGAVGTTKGLPLPTSFDWRNHKPSVVTPVKDQGQCGSCWAFSTVENVESMWALANNTLVQLSPQQVVSCDTGLVNHGCNGGEPPFAYDYIVRVGGLELNADYPYTSGNGADGHCNFDKSKIAAHIRGYQWATRTHNEPAMQQALFEWGPLSICVDATTWQDYTGGVVSANCGAALDHCVQLVGWNVDTAAGTYWIVRNSWNTNWGVQGYIYIKMGSDLCGIAKEATAAVV